MKDRIKQIMDYEDMTPTRFADTLQISRAVISHILNGRNNPSLDVVSKILIEMPYIDPSWLVNGTGEMFKDGYENKSYSKESNLFNSGLSDTINSDDSIIAKEIMVNKVISEAQSPNTKQDMPYEKIVRKISQIIIYYDDNTFETFIMGK